MEQEPWPWKSFSQYECPVHPHAPSHDANKRRFLAFQIQEMRNMLPLYVKTFCDKEDTQNPDTKRSAALIDEYEKCSDALPPNTVINYYGKMMRIIRYSLDEDDVPCITLEHQQGFLRRKSQQVTYRLHDFLHRRHAI